MRHLIEVVDLSPNTRLRSVTLQGRFKEKALLEWVLPTLLSIASDSLEHVSLVDCVVVHGDTVRDRCRPLDEVLANLSKSRGFRRLELRKWIGVELGPRIGASQLRRAKITPYASTQGFLRNAFPRCHALGILYDNDGDVSL